MTRLSLYLDRVIDAGLIFLVVFTPLAFGTVEVWSVSIAQFVVVLVFAAWVLKVVWGPKPLVIHLDEDGTHGRASRSGLRRWRGLFGGRVVLSGLEWPAVLFGLLIIAQMIPLPLEWLEAVQPRTAEVVRKMAPPADTEGRTTVRAVEAWLLGRHDPVSAGGQRPAGSAGDAESVVPDHELSLGGQSRHGLSLSSAATRHKLEIYLAYLAIFVVGVNHWRDRRHADRVVFAIAGTGGLLALVGILQRVTRPDRILWLRPASEGHPPFGPFVNHNHFAGYMEMAVPVALGLAWLIHEQARLMHDPSARLLDLGESVVPRFMLLLATAIFGTVALLACRSRGGLLAFLMAVSVYLGLAPWRRGRWARSALAGLLLVAMAVGVAARVGGDDLWEHYTTLSNPSGEPSFEFRLETSRRTLAMARDFPVTGVGLGVFQEVYPAYAPGNRVRRTGAAHDDYAQLLAETGAVGGLLALVAIVIFLLRFLVPALARTGSPRRHLTHGIAVGCLALAIHSAFDFNLQIYSNGLLFVILAALLAADRIARIPRPGGVT
ncbi:MAG: O-antigen ligase family protein [Acidobacteriota bacterium]